LIVEYVGEMDRYVPPVLISASLKEGEWYKQHVITEFDRSLAPVEVVPASVLHEITESPLLRLELERAKPVDDEPRARQNVRFTAGAGHHHVQIMVDAQTGTKILKDIVKMVSQYSALKSDLQEIQEQVKQYGRNEH